MIRGMASRSHIGAGRVKYLLLTLGLAMVARRDGGAACTISQGLLDLTVVECCSDEARFGVILQDPEPS